MNSNIKYIYELPYKPKKQLCDILDADRRWKELGKYMKYDDITITLIGQAFYRGDSPTLELLNYYSERNGIIKYLFIWLYKMNHKRAMCVLEPYVDQKYHKLLRNESTFSASLSSYLDKKVISSRLISKLSETSMNSLSQMSQVPSTHKHLSGACGISYKGNSFSKDLTFENRTNIHKTYNSHESYSKLLRSKSLNVPPMELKMIPNKSPDLMKCVHSKGKISNYASNKQKNSKKLSVPGRLCNNGAHSNSQCDSSSDFLNVPFNEICKATDNFNEARVLGSGGFGTVYRGEWKGISVAIKRLIPKKSNSTSRERVSFEQSLNELKILKRCRFDHILPLYAISLDGNDPCLIYQLMVNGSLEDRLLCKNKTLPLTWLQRSHIAECAAKGLNYLHTTCKKPLVHGDIKSANILLDSNMEAKIGDFGLTKEGPNYDNTHVKVSSVQGTFFYLPDEYRRDKKLSPQVDIFSYGIVMLEIATGLRPFDFQTKKSLVEQVNTSESSDCLHLLRDVKAGEEYMLWFKKLIRIGQVCSSREKKKRPTMQEVLRQFEEIKTEISKTGLSNDGGNTFRDVNMNMSPTELIYCFKKEDKVLKAVPDNPVINDISLANQQMKNVSLNVEETDSSFKSPSRSDSCMSSESTTSSETSVNQKIMKKGTLYPDKNVKVEAKNPPMPSLSILKIPVSEFEVRFDEPDSEKLLYDETFNHKLIERRDSNPDKNVKVEAKDPSMPSLSILNIPLSEFKTRFDEPDFEKSLYDGTLNNKLTERRDSCPDKNVKVEAKDPLVPLLSILNIPVSEFETRFNEPDFEKSLYDGTLNHKLIERRDSCPDKNLKVEAKDPLVPLLSILNMPVSEFESFSDNPISEKSLCYGNDAKL